MGKQLTIYVKNVSINLKHRFEEKYEFEEEDEWNELPISTPPYTICSKCNYDKCVPIDYKSKRGFHHIYKEN